MFLTFLNVIGPIGLGVGSISGGFLVTKFGVRKTLLAAGIFANIFSGFKLIENLLIIVSSKFFYGTSCGILIVCTGQALSESVPTKYQHSYGSILTNAGICLGIFLCNLVGVIVPLDLESEEMKADQTWRLIFGLPILFSILCLLYVHLKLPFLCLAPLLTESSLKQQAIVLIKYLYDSDPEKTYQSIETSKSDIESKQAAPSEI